MPSPPLIVTDGFLPAELALQMRRAIDEHFTNPQAHRPETHQVWNYWFVPELYTYLHLSARQPREGDRPGGRRGVLRGIATLVDRDARHGERHLALSQPLCPGLPAGLAQ